jgi:hypothetical protein
VVKTSDEPCGVFEHRENSAKRILARRGVLRSRNAGPELELAPAQALNFINPSRRFHSHHTRKRLGV